jgi:hypothetical protein|tara:strand:+ start:2400 stop:2627 length:228 start_codon:yes stop_codon:yes gene_type:complete
LSTVHFCYAPFCGGFATSPQNSSPQKIPVKKALSIMSEYRDKFEHPENSATVGEIEILEKWLDKELPKEYKRFFL